MPNDPTRRPDNESGEGAGSSLDHAQRLLSAHSPINNLFRPRRHRMAAADYRAVRTQALKTWRRVTYAQQTDGISKSLHIHGFGSAVATACMLAKDCVGIDNTVFGWRLRYSYWRELETRCTGGKDHETRANR